MTQEQFENIVNNAYNSMPEYFLNEIDNVHIEIKDYPTLEHVGKVNAERDNLLGLYQGIPLPKRAAWYGMYPTTPDIITLFKCNIEKECRNDKEVESKIREVLFHEIGHYFGMSEDEIQEAMKDFK